MQVEGHVAMVTGGASGIGRACALMLAREGADIVIADISPHLGDEAAGAVEGLGRRAVSIPTDTAERSHMERIAKAGIDAFGKIDIVVNGAGIPGSATIRDLTDETWHRTLDVHLKSMMLSTQAVMDSMIAQKWGRIVNIISRASFKGRKGTTVYAAAKAGMLGLSRSLAYALGEHGITVNNVAPGFIDTPMTSGGQYSGGPEAHVQAQIEAGMVLQPYRFGVPDEIAQAVLYYCGPNSGHTTGNTIHVNGGTHMP